MVSKLGIVGLGKLGLPLALVLAKAGFKVFGCDTNPDRVDTIKQGKPIDSQEPHVLEYLEKYSKNIFLSTNIKILKDLEIVIILTQSPSLPSGKLNLFWIENAVRNLHEINEKCLIVISSNVPFGSIDKLFKLHGRICHNPEYVGLGTIIEDFENPKYGLIGAHNEYDAELIARIWKKVHDRPIYIVKPIESEIIKLVHNVNCSLGIVWGNAIGELCEKYGASSNKVLEILYKERRNYKSGLGYGGTCFPETVEYLKIVSRIKNLIGMKEFTNLLEVLNQSVVEVILDKIESFNKKKIGILGMAFKPNVPYVYNSQPMQIAEKLLKGNFEVYVFDPLASKNLEKVFENCVNFHVCESIEECSKKSDILFIGTKNYSGVKASKQIVNPWSDEYE